MPLPVRLAVILSVLLPAWFVVKFARVASFVTPAGRLRSPVVPHACGWGRRGFMGFLSTGNRILMSDCFIRWFWAGFAAKAAFSKTDIMGYKY